jgi:hypothetical protein
MASLPLGGKFETLYAGLLRLRGKPLALAAVMGLSLVSHSLGCCSLILLSRGLGMNFDILGSMIVIPLGLFISTFGYAGGLGVGNLGFESLFVSMLGAAKGVGFTFSLAYQLLGILLRLGVGLPFYLAATTPPEDAELAEG